MDKNTEDYLKAIKKADREMEIQLTGNGFHSKTKIFKNKKKYDRKQWKNQE